MFSIRASLFFLLVGVSFLNALQLASENTSFDKDESKQFKKIIKVRNSVLEKVNYFFSFFLMKRPENFTVKFLERTKQMYINRVGQRCDPIHKYYSSSYFK